MVQFSPSLMCLDYMNMKEQLEVLNDRVDRFHVDFMDGHYCPNITLSSDLVQAMRTVTNKPMDVHFMATAPMLWIPTFAEMGCEYLSPHAEVINVDAYRVLDKIRELGAKPGVVLNPATPLDSIRHYLNRIEMLTIMTVDVGFAGQKFIPEMLEKISEAKQLKEEHGYNYIIQIDGSCNKTTYKRLVEAGAESLVVGSSGLFNLDPDVSKAMDLLEQQFEEETGVKYERPSN